MMDDRDSGRKGRPIFTPDTPGPEDAWPTRQNSSNSGHFDIDSPPKQASIPMNTGNRRVGAHPLFGAGPTGNPSMTLRNMMLSPIKRPQLARKHTQIFT
ncbi:hypothetical protein L6164_005883 [Bauhinia variegata]|uniref:Uncharacterized protein n=1 Tax=Bauhinia variegata TaxID=167791 RepID=A0ACB9PU39_BAUVA|nr:hypothetical protein L6164_005883 [Bauhinia variegata]